MPRLEMTEQDFTQTLEDLAAMGLITPFYYADEDGQTIRYLITGRPGDADEDDEDEQAAQPMEVRA